MRDAKSHQHQSPSLTFNTLVLIPFLVLLMLLTVQCSKGPTEPPETLTGQASLTLLIPRLLQTTIEDVRVTVSAQDMNTIQQSLTIQDTTASGTISDILAGPARVFTVDVYKTGGIRSHTGSDTTDILAGQTVELTITLTPLTGTVNITVFIPGIPIDQWTTGAPITTARWGASSGVINGKLYVVGGYNDIDSTGYLTSTNVYDPDNDTWSTVAAIPTAKHKAVSGVIGGILYVTDGVDAGGSSPSTWAYDPGTDTWTQKAQIPTARGDGAAAAVIDNKLYVAGGWLGGALSDLEIYDPQTDSWATGQSMPSTRANLHGGNIGGKLYLAGGVTDGPIHLDTLEIYDPSTNTWSSGPAMPTARTGLVCGVIGDRLYAAGGKTSSTAWTPILEVYDSLANIWISRASMPTARAGAVAGVISGRFYIIGGKDNYSIFDKLEIYTP